MIFALVAGSTETARIEGISAAGATPALLSHTPSADIEIVKYGRPVQAPVTPVSPSGCPTPAVITRAVREKLAFEMIGIDAGLARSTTAPTLSIGSTPGQDIRTGEAVSNAREIFERAREVAVAVPTEELVVGETIPGGTTTALAVLSALGERATVSSSLSENPMALKRTVVEEALETNNLAPGGLSGDPLAAVEQVGDPVLAVVFGLIEGATSVDTDVILAGGTQLAVAGALARHAGITAPLTLATTRFVADDGSVELERLTTDLDLDLTVTDPGFDQRTHPALDAYVAGEAKEGVGMGGALALSKRADIPMEDLREQTVSVYERLLEEPPTL